MEERGREIINGGLGGGRSETRIGRSIMMHQNQATNSSITHQRGGAIHEFIQTLHNRQSMHIIHNPQLLQASFIQTLQVTPPDHAPCLEQALVSLDVDCLHPYHQFLLFPLPPTLNRQRYTVTYWACSVQPMLYITEPSHNQSEKQDSSK